MDLLEKTDKLRLSTNSAGLTTYININHHILIKIDETCVGVMVDDEEDIYDSEATIYLTVPMAKELIEKLQKFILKIESTN